MCFDINDASTVFSRLGTVDHLEHGGASVYGRVVGQIIEYDSRTIRVCAVAVNVGIHDLHKKILLF